MVKYYYYKKGVHNEIKDFYAHMCKIASQLLHEYKKPNLVVYGKILYEVKIKADFSYTIRKACITKSEISMHTCAKLLRNYCTNIRSLTLLYTEKSYMRSR